MMNVLFQSLRCRDGEKGRSRQGERYGETGGKAVPPREKGRTSPVRGGRGKHLQRPLQMIVAAAAIIRSVRCEPIFYMLGIIGLEYFDGVVVVELDVEWGSLTE